MEEHASFNTPNEVKETRKRRMLNISEKVELIKLMQNTPKKKKEVAAIFGIPINTVGAIYANREKILEKCKGDFTNMNLKRLRPSTYPDIEEGLLNWYIENHANGHISCLTLRTKALEVAKSLGHENFSASNGWIERFKSRHNLKFKRNRDKNSSSVVVNDASQSGNDTSNNEVLQSGSDTSGNDVSHNASCIKTENYNQFESDPNNVWGNTSSPVKQEITDMEQECGDSYSFNAESHTSSHQNGNDRSRESSPSPSHLIPEVHLTETMSDSDNQICLQNDSHNFAYEMNNCNMTIQSVENAFNVIAQYVENSDGTVSEKTLQALKDLKTFISSEKKRKLQSKITDYFNSA